MSEVKETALTQATETLEHGLLSSQMPTVWNDKAVFDQTLRAAQMLSQTSLVPQSYQGKPQDCFLALEIAGRMNVSPMVVMQNMYVVKGKPTWAGQACMTLINSCGKFKDVRHVYTGTKGSENRGCYIEAVRISNGEVVQGTEVTLQMAKNEGWLANSKWKNMPEQMLGYRAAAFFARMHCPEALAGMQTREEVYDVDAASKANFSAVKKDLKERVAKAGKVGENNG